MSQQNSFTKNSLPNFNDQQISFKTNVQTIKAGINSSDTKLLDLIQYLEKQYPYGCKKVNLGSLYHHPIQVKGVELVSKYFYWDIQMLNLTMHKIQDQGLQIIINQNLINNYNNQNYYHNQNQPIADNKDQKHQSINKSKSTWNSLTQLSIIKNNISGAGFRNIQKANLKKLKKLNAEKNKLDHSTIQKFVASDWPNFQQLVLSSNNLGKQACKVLMNSKWKHFRSLDLNYNNIGNEGVHYLSEADWPQLVQINLSNNKIDASSTFYLRNANWPELKQLMLNKNLIGKIQGKITQIGCLNITKMKSDKIRKLSLYGNQLTLNAITLVLQSKHFQPDCFLQLSRNHFKFQEIKQLLTNFRKFCNQFQN